MPLTLRFLRCLSAFGLSFAFLAVLGNVVCASAFLAPAGEGQIITTTSFSTSSRLFDAHGRLIPVSSYQKFELGTYFEYGVMDWLTAVATPSIDHIHTGQPQTAVGIGDSAIGARARLYQSQGFVVSAQGMIRPPLTLQTDPTTHFFDHTKVWTGELRGLVGISREIEGYDVFADLEVGYRWNDQITPDEWHADATLGVHATPWLMILLQDFATVSNGRTAANESYYYDKGQLSAVYSLTQAFALQAGGFLTLAGRNAGREMGPIVALWYRF